MSKSSAAKKRHRLAVEALEAAQHETNSLPEDLLKALKQELSKRNLYIAWVPTKHRRWPKNKPGLPKGV